MTILDANIVLYAYNPDAPQHSAVAGWLEKLFSGPDLIGIPWQTIWAFLRVSTNVRLGAPASAIANAFKRAAEWQDDPRVVIVQPGPRHLELLRQLVIESRATAPLITDAALAALAIENGAVLASTDRDFSRFPNLRGSIRSRNLFTGLWCGV